MQRAKTTTLRTNFSLFPKEKTEHCLYSGNLETKINLPVITNELFRETGKSGSLRKVPG
jgi:hypothetical protein